MENFFYTVTPELKEHIERIKAIHSSITLFLLTPHDELKAQWEDSIRRLTHCLLAEGVHTNTHSVITILKPTKIKKKTDEEKLVYGYKNGFDYAKREWYASDKRITTDTLHTIIQFFKPPTLSIQTKELDHILNFVQIKSEHPIVQASLAHALVEIYQPFTNANTHLSTILPYLFLYKHGYYFRSMLDIEEYRIEHKPRYDDCIDTMKETNNLSGIIEFYTNAILEQAQRLEKKLQEKKFDTTQSNSFFQLTDRQKQILSYFDEPGVRLTNRKVQALFDVSQITASRDLARLAELNLLFSSGKGRSVFYTKI